MHNAIKLATGLLFAAATVATLAHDGAPHAAALRFDPLGAPLDFTLPTLNGKRFVQASSFSGPVLVNFWGKDCGPCIEELPRLEAFALANPQWTVLLVSTDTTAEARAFVERHGLQQTVLRPGANVIALMRKAGNPNGGLPFTVALRQGRICELQLGDMGAAELQRVNAACSAANKP